VEGQLRLAPLARLPQEGSEDFKQAIDLGA
jgi:hypothetical protein